MTIWRLRALGVALAMAVTGAAGAASAAGGAAPLPEVDWSFEKLLGTYDRAAAQRGLQVYKEVCASCHSLSLVAYRNLHDLGLSEGQVKAMAAEVQVTDGPNDSGEMFDRPGRPSDHFRKPFPNEQAARAANNGAAPPDLSLMCKARVGGPDYIHALLNGYADPAALTSEQKHALGLKDDFKLQEGMNFNLYFPGHQLAMARPLNDGQVTYADGAPNDTDSMSKDLTTFLCWAAEPKMEDRKRTGQRVEIYMVALAGLMYAVKRRVWANVPH